MESESSAGPPSRASGAHAQQVLADLDNDRATLAQTLAAPRWLYPLVALIVAGFLATPAIRTVDPRNIVTGILIAAAIALVLTYRRHTGVRVGQIGARGAGLLVGLLVVTLLLLSTSFGLSASLNPWWVVAPALVGFAVVLAGGRWFDRLYRENLRRGR